MRGTVANGNARHGPCKTVQARWVHPCVITSAQSGRDQRHGKSKAIGVRWFKRWPEGVEIMSVIGEIRVSLDAIGFEQQAFLFAFLTSYPLAIGRLLESRGRIYAAYIATGATAGFTIVTTPWI